MSAWQLQFQPTRTRRAESKETQQLEQQFLLYDDGEALGCDHQVLSTQYHHLISLLTNKLNLDALELPGSSSSLCCNGLYDPVSAPGLLQISVFFNHGVPLGLARQLHVSL